MGDKGSQKPEVDEAMPTAGDGHFTGLRVDEYPVTKHLGANKVPFIIGTSVQLFSVSTVGIAVSLAL